MSDPSAGSIEAAIRSAMWMLHTKGITAGTSVIPYDINTKAVRKHILLASAKWKTLDRKLVMYTEREFCLTSDPDLYATLFRLAFNVTNRFNMDTYIKSSVSAWKSSPVYEAFVLSKTTENMSWHVDGGAAIQSDLVVYIVMDPSDAISCFLLLAVDRYLHLQAQCRDSSFPGLDQIDAGLLHLDDLNLAMKAPNLTGCHATLHGLSKYHELNGSMVTIVQYLRDGKYHVTLESTGEDKVVSVRYLDLRPQFSPLPDEISSTATNLSPAVRKAIAEGVVRCYCIWARAGQVVVFDGSKPHGVYNFGSATKEPQLALAVNYRGVLPYIAQINRRVRLKLCEQL